MSNFSHDPESLAKHLDNFMPPGQFVTPQETGDPLIDAAAMFAQTSAPQLSNEAMERIQARILNIHQAQQPVQQTQTARLQPQSRQARLLTGSFARGMMRWGAVASFVCIVLLLGLTPAIANSLPGELFYPAKQAIEQIELTFARSPETQAIVHIQHAERRANEALALLARGQFKPELVEQALQDMRASADAARANGDSTALIALRGRTLQVDTALTFIMSEAQYIDVAFAATVAPLATSAQINRDNDALLLSTATVTITPSPLPSNTATTVLEATATPLPDTEVPTEPATESPTEPSTELPTNVPETAVPEATLQLTDLAPDDQFIDFPIAIIVESMVDVVDGDIVFDGITYEVAPEIDLDQLVVGKPVSLTVTFDAAGAMIVSQIGLASNMNAGMDDLHPIGTAIADTFDVPYETVMAQFDDGNGFGNLARAYLVAAETGVAVNTILSLHEADTNWSEIIRQYDLDPSLYSNGRIIGRGHVGQGLGQQELTSDDAAQGAVDYAVSTRTPGDSSQSQSGERSPQEPPGQSQDQGQGSGDSQGNAPDTPPGQSGEQGNSGGNGNAPDTPPGQSGEQGNGNGNSGGNGNGGGNGNDD